MRLPSANSRLISNSSFMSIDFSADFMPVGAMNPRFCGNYTDPSKECTCTPLQIQKYMSRLSGPLLDQIDLHVEVPAVQYKELSCKAEGESSASNRLRVISARMEAIPYRGFGWKPVANMADIKLQRVAQTGPIISCCLGECCHSNHQSS